MSLTHRFSFSLFQKPVFLLSYLSSLTHLFPYSLFHLVIGSITSQFLHWLTHTFFQSHFYGFIYVFPLSPMHRLFMYWSSLQINLQNIDSCPTQWHRSLYQQFFSSDTYKSLNYSLVTCFFVQFLLRYLLLLFTRSARPFLICFVHKFYIFHSLYDPVKLRIANHSAAFCIHLWSFCVTVRDKLPYYMNINRYINQCDIGSVNVYLFRRNEWSVQIFLALISTHM